MMMSTDYNAWRIHFDDILSEIDRLRTEIKDLEFNSEYPAHTHMIKHRLAILEERRRQIFNQVTRDAKEYRARIEDNVAAMREMSSRIFKELAETRMLRATRNRANHLHVIELERQRMQAAVYAEAVEAFTDNTAVATEKGGER